MGRELKMKALELKIISHQLCHPEDTSEGSTNLINNADSSLSLRVTTIHCEFLIGTAA